jgi:hypothetical protein
MEKGNRQRRKRLVLLFPIGPYSGSNAPELRGSYRPPDQALRRSLTPLWDCGRDTNRRALHIRRRALVPANAASAHSTSPTTLDAILPTAQSRLCPPSSLAHGALPLRPKPLERIPQHLRDCRAECWPTRRAPQPAVRVPALEDRRPLDSWRYSTSRLLSFRARRRRARNPLVRRPLGGAALQRCDHAHK